MSNPHRDPNPAWLQGTSSADLYHHQHHPHHPQRQSESSSQASWPSVEQWRSRAEEPRRSPPTPLKLPQSAGPADETDLSRQLDQVVDLLSQQPRSDGGPRRPMNAFLIFARWRRMQLAQADSVPDLPMWTTEGRKRTKPATPELGLKPSDVSTALGIEWRGLTPQQQAPFLRKAGELRNDFDRRHPDYKFRRGPKGAAKIRRQERRDRIAEARRRLQQHKALIQDTRNSLGGSSQPGYGYGLTDRATHDAQQGGEASLSGSGAGHYFAAADQHLPDRGRRSFSLSDNPPETPILESASLLPYTSDLSTQPSHMPLNLQQPHTRTRDNIRTYSVTGSTVGLPDEAATLPNSSATVADTRCRGNATESHFWTLGSRTDLPPLHHSIDSLSPSSHKDERCTLGYAVTSHHAAPSRDPNHEGLTDGQRSKRPPLIRHAVFGTSRLQSSVARAAFETTSSSPSSSQTAWTASAAAQDQAKAHWTDDVSRVSALYLPLPPPRRQQLGLCPLPDLHDGRFPHSKYRQHHQYQHQHPHQQHYSNIGSYHFPSHAAIGNSNSSSSSSIGSGLPVSDLPGESIPWTAARDQDLPEGFRSPTSTAHPHRPQPAQGEGKLSRVSSTLEAALHFSNSSLPPKMETRPRAASQLQRISRLQGAGAEEVGQYSKAIPPASTGQETETEPAQTNSAFSRLMELKFGRG